DHSQAAAAADVAADGQRAFGVHNPVTSQRDVAGSHVQVVGPGEREVGLPYLRTAVERQRRAAGVVDDRVARSGDGQRTATQRAGIADIQPAIADERAAGVRVGVVEREAGALVHADR